MGSRSVQQTVILLSIDPAAESGISQIVSEAGHAQQTVATPEEMRSKLRSTPAKALILDIDSVPVDNRSIRDLAMWAPGTPILCISRERFHPELQESISRFIYACLTKPVDKDELHYWLKCIQEDELKPAPE